MEKKQTKKKKELYEIIIREAFCKELSDYLDSLLTLGIVVKSEVKRAFGMDYKTLNNICLLERPVLDMTLLKMPYILAYCLTEYKKKIEAEPYGKKKVEKLNGFPAIMARFKALYGFQATFCLDLINEGKDLRAIVRQTTKNN